MILGKLREEEFDHEEFESRIFELQKLEFRILHRQLSIYLNGNCLILNFKFLT